MNPGGISVNGIHKMKVCGEQLVCMAHEYCSDFHDVCEHCSNLCDFKSHNFNPLKCNMDCQDYLHDVTYVRKDDETFLDNKRKVDQLYIMITIQLFLICLITLYILIASYVTLRKHLSNKSISFGSLFTRKFRKMETAKSENSLDLSSSQNHEFKIQPLNNNTTTNSNYMQTNASMKTTSTTLSSANNFSIRIPTEDNAAVVERAAYDNRAMMTTPSPTRFCTRPHESSF